MPRAIDILNKVTDEISWQTLEWTVFNVEHDFVYVFVLLTASLLFMLLCCFNVYQGGRQYKYIPSKLFCPKISFVETEA